MADTLPNIRAAHPRLLQRLSRVDTGDSAVLTVYFDLDPSQFPTPDARQTQLNSTLNELTERIGAAELSHDARETALADAEKIRDRFSGETIPEAENAGALAIFCCTPADLFEIVKLPVSVPPSCHVGNSAFIEPVADLLAEESWIVLLVNRTTARVFRGGADTIEEVLEVEDDVHRQHQAGGWSQKRFERSIDKEVADHLNNVADRLFRLNRRAPFDNLLIGTTTEMMPLIEDALHPDVARVVRGRFDVDVEHTTRDDVLAAAKPLIEEQQKAREREVLDRLAQELGRGGRAVASENDVRRALHEGRVEVLVLDDPDGAGDEIDLALGQSADVLVVRHHDDLREIGSIAALLRY